MKIFKRHNGILKELAIILNLDDYRKKLAKEEFPLFNNELIYKIKSMNLNNEEINFIKHLLLYYDMFADEVAKACVMKDAHEASVINLGLVKAITNLLIMNYSTSHKRASLNEIARFFEIMDEAGIRIDYIINETYCKYYNQYLSKIAHTSMIDRILLPDEKDKLVGLDDNTIGLINKYLTKLSLGASRAILRNNNNFTRYPRQIITNIIHVEFNGSSDGKDLIDTEQLLIDLGLDIIKIFNRVGEDLAEHYLREH